MFIITGVLAGISNAHHSQGAHDRIIESLRLEKTSKIIKPNRQPNTTMPAKPCPRSTHFLNPPRDEDSTTSWAAWSNAWPKPRPATLPTSRRAASLLRHTHKWFCRHVSPCSLRRQPMQANRLPQALPTPHFLQAPNTHLMNCNGAADVWELVTLLYVVCVSEYSDSSPFASEELAESCLHLEKVWGKWGRKTRSGAFTPPISQLLTNKLSRRSWSYQFVLWKPSFCSPIFSYFVLHRARSNVKDSCRRILSESGKQITSLHAL